MVGDGRRFLSMLIVPAFPRLEGWAESRGIDVSDRVGLLEHPEVQRMMQDVVFGELDGIARFELPKKLALLATEFTVEDGALTPTQKVKRKVVAERYKRLIDSFYSDEHASRTVFSES